MLHFVLLAMQTLFICHLYDEHCGTLWYIILFFKSDIISGPFLVHDMLCDDLHLLYES